MLGQIESDEQAAQAEAAGPPRPPQDPAARHRWAVMFDAGLLRQPAPGTRWDDDSRLRRDRRGMIVLSRVGSAAAVDCLRELAAGAPAAPRTLQAAAALSTPEPSPAPAAPGGH